MLSVSNPISQLIDDYLDWFVRWHNKLASGKPDDLGPPTSFAAWRAETLKSMTTEQPAVENLTQLHEQLHKLVKLVLMGKGDLQKIEPKDDENIANKYLELMQELRRFERAFAMAAAQLDPLTGLRTRRALMNDLDKEISRVVRTGSPFFIAIMDIDHFKLINDTYGHESGDRVLAAVANQVSHDIRLHDEAYRIGGEEFLVCLTDTDADGGKHVVERLRKNLEKTPILLADGKSIPVTASFGAALCNDAVTADELLRSADTALYRAKHEGRNRVVMA